MRTLTGYPVHPDLGVTQKILMATLEVGPLASSPLPPCCSLVTGKGRPPD
jgi:hypothetical protein